MATSHPPKTEEAEPPKKRGSWLRWLGLGLIPLIGGSLGYMGQVLLHPSEPATAEHAAEEGSDHGSEPSAGPGTGHDHGADRPDPGHGHAAATPVPKIHTPELHQIDELLAAGDYQQARALFQEGKKGLPGPLPADLRARYALCAELYGDFKLALDIYRELAGDVEDRNLQRFAKISQGRLLYAMSEFGQAESILYELALATGDGSSQREQEAIWHLLAHAAADRLQSSTDEPDLLDTATLDTGSRDWFRPLLVPELNTTSPENSTHEPAEEVVFENWKVEADATQASGKVWTQQVEVTKILDTLINTLRVHGNYSPMAKEILRGRTLHVHVDNIAASTLLDAILFPLELTWGLEPSGELRISAMKELTQTARTAQYEERAERVALRAITQYSGSAGAPITKFKLATLAFVRGQFAGAAAQYRQLLAERPPVVVRQATWFNLAKTHYLGSEWDLARDAFLHVVDESRGHALESIAYLWLARMEQEALAYDKAETHLVRAIALAKDDEVKATATLAMATNLLLAGNPQAAAITLQENRESLLKSNRRRAAAALLSALARKEAPSRDQNTPLSSRLLATAIIQARAEDFLGYTGYSLLTRGYRLLGLSEQELAKLDEAVRKMPVNQLHYELRMELVRKQMARQMDDQARTHLEFLMQSSPDIYGQQAQFLLAQLSYRQSQYAACAGQLRKLLSEKVPTELRDQSLALLGKTYSSLGQHYEAAMCFAGLLPGEQERPVAIKGNTP